MEKNKKVLLTNAWIKNYSGSEIDTVTIANYFAEHNYDVDIFTIQYDEPLKTDLNNKIRLINYFDSHLLASHYDLIWSHHWPLLDYILFNKKITADYINYVSLSTFELYEKLPQYYQELTVTSLLSNKSFEVLKESGFDVSKSFLFPNYATKDYFDYGQSHNQINKKLKSVCVVSNHVPTEICDCCKLFEKEHIKCDIYGYGNKYIKIDVNVLKKYDLIISIGKTVNYALAMKKAVFCYDRFGGDLFITKNNIKKSFDWIFSGRTFGIKKKDKSCLIT